MIQILNEYGIYFMNYGLTETQIVWFKTMPYKNENDGNSRWVICINDFVINERVRIYPGWNHIFHLKCSQLWLEIEGICPVCSNTPKDLPPPPENVYQSLNPLNDRVVSITDIFSSENNQVFLNAPQNILPAPVNPLTRVLNNENPDNNLREPLLNRP